MVIRAGGVRVAYPLFQEGGSGSIPTSALQLRFDPLELKRAIELNRHWHSRLPRVVYSNIIRTKRRISYGAEFDGLMYACAIWTNPVARMLPQDWLELRRLAIADDRPKNTATRMIGWMVRDIHKRFPEVPKLISYQDSAVHAGTIYKAAGWKAVRVDAGGEWSRPSRHREKVQSDAPKVRWEFEFTD